MSTLLSESVVSADCESKVIIATPETIDESSKRLLKCSIDNLDARAPMIRSACDKYDYKLVKLSNGIRLMLVSDPSYKDLQNVPFRNGFHSQSMSSESRISASLSNAADDDRMDVDDEESADGEDDDEVDDDEEEEEDYDDDDGGALGTGRGLQSGEKTSAIVVAVKVGSFQDPDEFPGMAHMLEHLISMGCEEFPEENYLDDFLNSRGGDQNAFTECEHTCYQINVQRSFLQETLNLIAKTFKSPLLRQSSIEREIEPIDSEFTEASSDDETRVEMLLSYLSNKDSYLHKFLWGNTKSLITIPASKGLNTREAVLKWYKRYYKPQNMVVVVQSQESMDNLLKWSQVFEEISPPLDDNSREEHEDCNKQTAAERRLPFENNSNFNKLYIVESAEIGYHLVISWILKPILKDYMKASFDYLATLIGYEGVGSLLSELKRNNYSTSLRTNSNYFTCKINNYYSIFQIEIELTEHGLKNLENIVSLIKEYLNALQRTGTQEYFFRENQTISLNSFNMASELDSVDNAERLAQNILFYPTEHVLIGKNVYYYYDPEDIDHMFNQFRLDNANFMLVGADFRPGVDIQEEEWMKTKFQQLNIPDSWLHDDLNHGKRDKLVERFFYPKSNKFISTDFALIDNILDDNSVEKRWPGKPETMPEVGNKRIAVWYKPDFVYKLPKARVCFHIMSPVIEGDCWCETQCDIFCELLLFELNEHCYDADLAQLSFSLSRSFNGIQLHASGFNHKLPDLIKLIFERLIKFEPEANRFEIIKKELLKNYNNQYYDNDRFARDLRLKCLLKHYSTFVDRSVLVPKVTFEDIQKFREDLLNSLTMDVLVQGNITHQQTVALVMELGDLLKRNNHDGRLYEKVNFEILKLPVGKRIVRRLCFNPKSEMNHVVCYYQLHQFNFKSNAILSLFIDIIHEMCFNYLRTKEGLGYSVGVDLNDTFGILGFNVYVTSPAKKYDCEKTQEKIDHFIMNVTREQLCSHMTDEKYEEHLESLITRKREKDVSLDEEVGRNMGEIMGFNYCFDRREREIEHLTMLKNNRSLFLEWLQNNVWTPEKKRQLNIEIVGLCEHSMNNVRDLDGRSVDKTLVTEYVGDCLRDICLTSAAQERSEEFILDIDAFKNQNTFYKRQPPTVELQS